MLTDVAGWLGSCYLNIQITKNQRSTRAGCHHAWQTILLGDDPYAQLYDWPKPFDPETVVRWIERAYIRREGQPPINTLPYFGRNRTTVPEEGWQ